MGHFNHKLLNDFKIDKQTGSNAFAEITSSRTSQSRRVKTDNWKKLEKKMEVPLRELMDVGLLEQR